MSGQALWNSTREPDMFDFGNLTRDKAERSDMSGQGRRICSGNLSGTRIRCRIRPART
jgi:hypothetical protein